MLDGVAYTILPLVLSSVKTLDVGSELSVVGAEKPLWCVPGGTTPSWQSSILLHDGAERGTLSRVGSGVTVTYVSGEREDFKFEGDDAFDQLEALYFAISSCQKNRLPDWTSRLNQKAPRFRKSSGQKRLHHIGT